MKRIIIVFLLLLSASTSFSQVKFENIVSDSLDQMPAIIVEIDNGYIIFEHLGNYFTNNYHTRILKMSLEGEIIQSKILKPSTYRFGIESMVKIEDGNYLCYGSQQSNVDSAAFFTAIKLDHNFNIIFEKNYLTDFSSISNINVEKRNNMWVVTGTGLYMNFSRLAICSYLLNENQDTVKTNIYEGNGITMVFDMIYAEEEDVFRLFTRGFHQQTNTSGQILKIDPDLQIIDIIGIPEYVNVYHNAKYLDNQSYLLSGKVAVSLGNPPNIQMALLKMNSEDSLLNHQLYGPPDTLDYPGVYTNLDFINESDIYYGGTHNYSVQTIWSPTKSWFILNKVNSNLELQWQKFYGGDAYYVLWNLIATQDGGCMMAGARFDYLTQDNERDLYIVKVNQDGLIVGTGEELPSISVQDAIVYPNPGNEYFHIQSGPQIGGAVFELFDLSGNRVLTTTLDERVETISTIQLSTGTYPYRITFDNKIVGSGKWVKQ